MQFVVTFILTVPDRHSPHTEYNSLEFKLSSKLFVCMHANEENGVVNEAIWGRALLSVTLWYSQHDGHN